MIPDVQREALAALAEVWALFDHLWCVETEQMGLVSTRSRTERVVDLLISLREQIEGQT
jgi:hypothetical protein